MLPAVTVEADPYLASLDEGQRFLLDHPDLFLVHYFGDEIEKLEPFHLRLIDTVTRVPRSLILYPAAHGKTTLCRLLTIYEMCRNPNVRIGYIAKNEREATQIGGAIQAELAENDRLIEDFGPFRPDDDDSKPWSLSRISVAKRTIRAKEPTLALFGSGAKTTLGHRTDITFCDDVVTDQNSSGPEQREKLRRWFNQSVRTMGRFPHSRLTVVGTLFHPEDLYGDLRELRHSESGERIWPEQREDAIVDEEAHTTLWPERWPWRALMEMKAEMGTLDFNKRLRNIAVDPSRLAFKEEYVKGGYIGKERYPGCLDQGFVIGDVDDSWPVFSGFDPAIGGSRHAKFCAHVSLAVGSCREHERCFWVADLRRDQMTMQQQIELIISQHERFNMLCSYVEANGYQAGLEQAVQSRLGEIGKAFRIEPHYTNRKNKQDPELGVMRLAPYFENGQVHIPQGNPESRRKMTQLIDELIQYPGRTTDTVMAFWFAWLAAEEATPKHASYNRLKKQSPYWHKKLGGRVVRNPFYPDPEAEVVHADQP